MDESYALVIDTLDKLPAWDKDAVLNGGIDREAFIERLVEKGLSHTHITVCLERIVAHQHQDIERLRQLDETTPDFEAQIFKAMEQQEILKEQVMAHIIQDQVGLGKTLEDAYAYQPTSKEYRCALNDVRNKHGVVPDKHEIMLYGIEETLENAKVIYGRPDLTKTQILKACRKDKGEWRKIAGDTLAYLASRGAISKVGARYYHKTNQVRMVETDFTRKVFEALYDGSKSINGIVKQIGYDNVFGRKKVRQTLDFLVSEELVLMENYRWRQNSLS